MKPLNLHTILFALAVLCVGLLAVFLISRLMTRFLKPRFSPHHLLLAQKSVLYIGIVLVVCTVLIQLQVNLTAVLGAAGIVTVAIGFAAQTSLSNLISGLFLLGERPFEVGDVIVVGTTRGVVLSIGQTPHARQLIRAYAKRNSDQSRSHHGDTFPHPPHGHQRGRRLQGGC